MKMMTSMTRNMVRGGGGDGGSGDCDDDDDDHHKIVDNNDVDEKQYVFISSRSFPVIKLK